MVIKSLVSQIKIIPELLSNDVYNFILFLEKFQLYLHALISN